MSDNRTHTHTLVTAMLAKGEKTVSESVGGKEREMKKERERRTDRGREREIVRKREEKRYGEKRERERG